MRDFIRLTERLALVVVVQMKKKRRMIKTVIIRLDIHTMEKNGEKSQNIENQNKLDFHYAHTCALFYCLFEVDPSESQ